MGLFLIAGPRRTGTTLLSSVCCSDPAANPLIAEAQILTRLVEAYRWGRLNFTLFGKSFFDDEHALRDLFAGMAVSFVEHARRRFAPASTLILKNPEFCLVIDDLRGLLPEAKVIVTLRDPRDQVASELDTGLRQIDRGRRNDAARDRDIAALCRTLLAYYEPVLAAAAGAPDRFLFVRFEDLLMRTTDTVDELRSFTGLALADFDPGDDWTRVGLDWNDYRHLPSITAAYGSKFDPSRVGRHRATLRSDEIATVEACCQSLMERWGYR
jgi:hypothetical protein